jgi:hypothetical protein
MPRPHFSAKYRLWGEWLKNANPNSSYTKRIIRLHQLFPDRSLKQLRSLKLSEVDPSLKPISELSLDDVKKRKISFHIIRKMQPTDKSKGLSLREAVKDYNLNNAFGNKITEKDVIQTMGNYIRKGKRGRYEFNPNGKLELRHGIYSNGKYIKVTISKEKERLIVKEYQNDLQKALNGHPSMSREKFMEKWKKKTIKDAKGNKIELEADIVKIREDMERRGDNYVVTISG